MTGNTTCLSPACPSSLAAGYGTQGAFHAPAPELHRARASDDIYVEILTRSAVQDAVLVPAVPEPMLAWVASGTALIEVKPFHGDWTMVQVGQGDFYLSAAPLPVEMRWRSTSPEPFTVMHVYVGLEALARVLRDTTGRSLSEFSLREASCENDPVLCGVLESLYAALSGTKAPLGSFLKGLAQALTAHLIQHYELSAERRKVVRGGLPAHKLHRVIDAMRANVSQPFDLGAYSEMAGLSVFHFSRVFKQATGMSPSHYVVRLRVDEARRLLRETDRPVIDIGMELGYRSPSHFTQVFRQLTGIPPSVYRRSKQ